MEEIPTYVVGSSNCWILSIGRLSVTFAPDSARGEIWEVRRGRYGALVAAGTEASWERIRSSGIADHLGAVMIGGGCWLCEGGRWRERNAPRSDCRDCGGGFDGC